jgi:hypothetical protein
MTKPETPETLQPHQKSYKQEAWMNYTLQELGDWIHLLVKRSKHRSDPDKKAKDLYDARNYWLMMGAMLEHENVEVTEAA